MSLEPWSRVPLVAALFVLGGCSLFSRDPGGRVPGPEPRAEPRSKYGNPESYVVYGRRYQVLASAEGYVERGIASWYGRKFHGRRTSSGETYDMYKMSAAHRSLPLPSYVLVTNLENGRRIVVRVNDRGPFVKNRLVDLSYVAAGQLGMRAVGTARVEVRALRAGARPATESPPVAEEIRKTRFLQAGAFLQHGRARALAARIERLGKTVRLERINLQGVFYHRVWVGPYGDARGLRRAQGQLRAIGVEAFEVLDVHGRERRRRACRTPFLHAHGPGSGRCRVI